MYILWRIFHISTKPIRYTCTFLSVNRRNNEARVHIVMLARASLFRRFTDTNVYRTGSFKLTTKYR